MLKVVRLLSEDPASWPTAQLKGQQVYHSDPLDASFGWMHANGFAPAPVPPDGFAEGVLVIPFHAGRGTSLDDLVRVVDRLLGPGGCPWDQAQTHESLKRHLLEEAYEVLEAIDSGDPDLFQEELGDLLLQPIMHAQMAKAAGQFDTEGVAKAIVKKLVRRHPHVFGDTSVANADEVLRNWDQIKKTEKGEPKSILAGVPKGMASLLRAYEVSKRAARAGFEWPNREAVFEKMREEEAELHEAMASGDQKEIEAEIGDMLFTLVNIARWSGVEPEEALRKMLDRFTRRFMLMEERAGVPLGELSAEKWDELWEQSKAELG